MLRKTRRRYASVCRSRANVPPNATNDETGQDEQVEIGYTRFVYKNNWFVLSQTDGKEYEPEPVPGWNAETALSNLNIERVPFTMMDGNVQGYAKRSNRIYIPLAEQPETTLFHELAHIVMGHTVGRIAQQ